MDTFISLVQSGVGVSIAWICTVISTIYSIYKFKENRNLKIKIESLESTINSDSSHNLVTQNGQKNIYTKQNSGGMKINM